MHDRELSALLSEAVADVEPADRLGEIRERTSPRRSRRGWYAAGGAMLAAAAAVTAIAVLGNQPEPRADDPVPPAGSPSGTPTDATPEPAGHAVPVYYVGPGPDGPDGPEAALYRYFEPFDGRSPLQLLTAPPSDPDYRTLWPEGAFADSGADFDSEVIAVPLTDASLRERPGSMTEREAELAVQQVVYTLQAEAGERRPVQFRLHGNPIDQVLGIPTSEPISESPPLDVLSHMSISDPAEEQLVSGSFTARGVNNGFEGTVSCALVTNAGSDPAWSGAGIGGWQGERLFPWELEVDLSDVPAGSYTFSCSTDDPTGGAEGAGAYVDTRTVVVE